MIPNQEIPVKSSLETMVTEEGSGDTNRADLPQR